MAETSLATINKATLELFQSEDIDMGDMEGGRSIPNLKIIQAMSLDNITLADGSDPKLGHWYHDQVQQQFQDLVVHVLAVKTAYLPNYTDKSKTDMNMLVAVYEESIGLAVIFIKGKSLSPFWAWQSETAKINKQVGIPPYALKTKISSTKEKNDYGTFYAAKFEVVRNEKGVVFESDPEKIRMLQQLIKADLERNKLAMKDKLAEIVESLNGDGAEDHDMTVVSSEGKKKSEKDALKVEDHIEEDKSSKDSDIADDLPF